MSGIALGNTIAIVILSILIGLSLFAIFCKIREDRNGKGSGKDNGE